MSGNRTESRVIGRGRGFSLLEMLVVLAIIGLLVALFAPRLTNAFSGGQVTTTKGTLQQLTTAVEEFRMTMKRLPTAEEGLSVLVERPESGETEEWKNFLGLREVPKDAWGNAFVYRVDDPDFEYVIISYGADGKPGGEGDAADLDNR
ncbi:MAG: type II secretion system major pseudopilin GspG [Phycisphaerales bacterium JB065]